MLNKPSKDLLVDKVNEVWGKNYAVAAVTFENLEVQPYDAERNTGITIKSAVGNEPIEEPRSIYYDRVKLAELQVYRLGADLAIEIADAGQLTTLELLDEINAILLTQLEAADIVDSPLPTTGEYPRGVVVKARPDSLVYIGQLSVVLTGTNEEPTP